MISDIMTVIALVSGVIIGFYCGSFYAFRGIKSDMQKYRKEWLDKFPNDDG